MAHSVPPQSLKHRVFNCLTKLSDRDTFSLAATELDSIARTLDPASLPTFISCLHSTDPSDKSPLRKQSVHLLATLAESHGNSLSPYLSKILTSLTRRLRDPDSSVRSTCISTTATLSSRITKPPFNSFLKHFTDTICTEQDLNSQIGAALCLASAIDAAPNPEGERLGKLLPRFEKLLKCESFKAKAALLTLIGSVVGAGGASVYGSLRSLVTSVVGFLSSEDWAARKAAAETLVKLALMERDSLAEFKAGCLKIFENRRYDKVKAVREVMNQMVVAWKQVPDVSDEASAPAPSQSSSREDGSDGRYPPGSKNSCTTGPDTPQMRKKPISASRLSPPDGSSATTARKRTPLKSSDKNTDPAMFQKLDGKKPSDWKVEISVPYNPSLTRVGEDDLKERNENIPQRRNSEKTRFSKPETKRALFSKNSGDKMQKFGGFRSGSRVAPCQEERSESTIVVSNDTENLHKNHKECEDLSLIRNQLVQIEKQQSSLVDLLQRFIGSSQNGMRSLETRVHGLELTLDEISYDLALSSGRMTNTDSPGTMCCMLPGADFLSSKFWKKTEGRYSTSRISTSSATSSVAAMRYRADKNRNAENFKLENHRFRLQGGAGFIVNPLAEIQSDSRGISEVTRH